jgi:hypothetical protein
VNIYSKFDIIGKITDVEPIAIRHSIRDLARLRKSYAMGRWRKLKGIATVRFLKFIKCCPITKLRGISLFGLLMNLGKIIFIR